jgi:hypothetical protein
LHDGSRLIFSPGAGAAAKCRVLSPTGSVMARSVAPASGPVVQGSIMASLPIAASLNVSPATAGATRGGKSPSIPRSETGEKYLAPGITGRAFTTDSAY